MSKMMTPKEVQAALQCLRGDVGGKADLYADINNHSEKAIAVTLWANGIGGKGGLTFRIEADEWDEALTAARAKWEEVRERVFAETVQKMALEIIRVTATKGECAPYDLRSANFTQDDIDRYGSQACVKANDMAGNGPFSLTTEAKANAA